MKMRYGSRSKSLQELKVTRYIHRSKTTRYSPLSLLHNPSELSPIACMFSQQRLYYCIPKTHHSTRLQIGLYRIPYETRVKKMATYTVGVIGRL